MEKNSTNAAGTEPIFPIKVPICCGNCKFFTPGDEKCHALPPEPKPSTGGYFFRATKFNEWCGLYEAKQ